MKKKIYSSLYFHYMTYVVIAGEQKIIEFKGGINYGNYEHRGTYTTNDEAMQQVIESDPRFGVEIFLDQCEELESQSNPNEVATHDEPSVTNLQEAKEYLKREGVPYQALTSASAVRQQAAKIGVTFSNMK